MREEKPEAGSQEPEGEKSPAGRFPPFAWSLGFCLRASGFRALVFSGFWLLAAGFSLPLLPGCSSSKAESPDQKSEKALRDPFNYSPNIEKTDVSGGGWLDYDKEGMRKDLRNVLDP